jgi:hypothetical protein
MCGVASPYRWVAGNVPRLPQPPLLRDLEGNIAAVAGSPTLHFPDRARLPCLATLALILTCKFGSVSFDSFRWDR